MFSRIISGASFDVEKFNIDHMENRLCWPEIRLEITKISDNTRRPILITLDYVKKLQMLIIFVILAVFIFSCNCGW